MKRLFKNKRRWIAAFLAVVFTMSNFQWETRADNWKNNKSGKDEKRGNDEGGVFTSQTTEEILAMIEDGLSLETFFAGDLTVGTTREDLLQWQQAGKDINDVVQERARERSLRVTYPTNKVHNMDTAENRQSANSSQMSENHNREANTDEVESANEDETIRFGELTLNRYLAAPDTDGKYYLTECSLPGDKGTVNLAGTAYEQALFNSKTGGRGASTPWYITLGGEEAMCVSYEGNASAVRRDHHYLEKNVDIIKNNPYFEGGSSYPLENYLKGACYAYERILGASGGSIYTFFNSNNALDAGLAELKRKVGNDMVTYSGREVNQAVLQIIIWRIAQGSFNANNLAYEHQLAQVVFRQMYGEDTLYGENYAGIITDFYDYYANCAREAANGAYSQKYATMNVKYWEVQGEETEHWQDFITWDAGSEVPVKKQFKITKYGKVFSENYTYPNALFYVYSDSSCTNKIAELRTDSKGEGYLNLVEGTYYLKEQEAPAGTVKKTGTITLTVTDTVHSEEVSNEEIENRLIFQKFDSNTKGVITAPGKFSLYEYVAGKNTYLKLCELSYTDRELTQGTVTIPANAYYMAGNTASSYHRNDGTVVKTLTQESFVYTPVNQGKFKLVEEEAPKGYQINTAGKEFTMKLDTQGYVWQFTRASSSIPDEPFYAGIVMEKYDTLSEEKLTGATFKVQEKIGKDWYDVGKLVYDEVNGVYKTAAEERYLYRNENGSIIFQKTGTDCPLLRDSFNNGYLRIVETTKPAGEYVDITVVKLLRLEHTKDQYVYDLRTYAGGIKNRGKAIAVMTAKYDAITQERLRAEDRAVMTVYEYHASSDEWLALGELVYNEEEDTYELDGGKYYTPHRADGSKSTAGVGSEYSAGYLYYTSANQGKFKVVETLNPTNYLLGYAVPDVQTPLVYEKEFTISDTVEDRQVIDLTAKDDAAQDTGIQANVILAKYDSITKDFAEGKAEFTVYERIGEEWLKVGVLVYDEDNKVYTAKGMTLSLHNSSKEVIYSEDDAEGLYYTSANQGIYLVRETKAPQQYVLGTQVYEQRLEITAEDDDRTIDLTSGQKAGYNLGMRGNLCIKKYDATTRELVRAGNAVVTVYEKIGDTWKTMGKLAYDETQKSYVTEGVNFVYHNLSGEPVDTDNVEDYEAGYLYYTAANQGRFKIEETAPPSFYTLTHPMLTKYAKELTLTENEQEWVLVDFLESIQNFGVQATVSVNKYDALTGEVTIEKDVRFQVEEYIEDQNCWLKVGEMVYDDLTSNYTLSGQEIQHHDGTGTVTFVNHSGTLYYSSQNNGRFRLREIAAPTHYVLGDQPYEKIFNIMTDEEEGIVNLTSLQTSAKNLGISGTVTLAKYDRVTREKVTEGDGSFTVYEYIDHCKKWLPIGTLVYDEEQQWYSSQEAEFSFHDRDGNVASIPAEADIETGKLYYTSANQGRFKVVETQAPTNYTQEPFSGEEEQIFEKEWLLRENGQWQHFDTLETGPSNAGRYTQILLQKYDVLTKDTVEATNAEFTVEEKIGSRWMKAGVLRYDEEQLCYTTENTNIVLHDSKGEKTYERSDGRLYYTNANLGRYRIRETQAPTDYVSGETPYCKEWNVLESSAQNIELTQGDQAAYNRGVCAQIEAVKYDDITKELVKTGDTTLTVYEYLWEAGEWRACGNLIYHEDTELYDGSGVSFVFHDDRGDALDLSEVGEYKEGYLYYTTANRGCFKLEETNAPGNYTNGGFSEEFWVQKDDWQTISFTERETAVYDRGEEFTVEVKKYDALTKASVEYKDIVLVVEEYIKDQEQWFTMGQLVYDRETDAYSTKGMALIAYHNSKGETVCTVKGDKVCYTSANEGVFRITEKEAPSCYENASTPYAKEFNVGTDRIAVRGQGNLVDLKGEENAARNIGISNTVRVAKFDSLTGDKVLSSDAVFTVYEYIDELASWLETGTLGFDEKAQEYTCENCRFVFHDENGNEIDTSGITDFEEGRLYYTTANDGNFKIVETQAPTYYRLDGYEKTFHLEELKDYAFTDKGSAASDSGIRGNIALIKKDSINDTPVSGAVFAAQEWSETEGAWLDVGILTDHQDGSYSTEGMTVSLHTGGQDIASDMVQQEGLLHKMQKSNQQNIIRKESRNDTGQSESPQNIVLCESLQYTTQNRGRFRIVEKKAPAGYHNDGFISDELVLNEEGKTIRLVAEKGAKDTPIRVDISKKSLTTGKELIGARLTVTDQMGKVIDSWITDGTQHRITAIPAGLYTLTEEMAPLGYQRTAAITFEVKDTMEIQKVTMFDEERKGRIVLHKTDKGTKQPLRGAVFALFDENGQQIETLITDEKGIAVSGDLSFGIYEENGAYRGSKTYRLVETKAPDGYRTDHNPIFIQFETEEIQDLTVNVVEKRVEIENESTPEVQTGDRRQRKPFYLWICSLTVAALGLFFNGKGWKKRSL